MELLKILYFVILGAYVVQCILAKEIKLNWILILTAVSVHALYFFGWEGIIFLFVTGIISTIAELVSLKTSFNIFGNSYKYDLSNKIFPSKITLGKIYPIEVTSAWILLKYLSFFMAIFILLPLGIGGVTKAVISAIILVSFDLILDPYAVSEGAWKWSKPGKFFEIPWRNFLGWFLVGLVISFIFMNLKPIETKDVIMIIPVFVASALFIILLGGRLLSMNRTMGIIALMPLLFFILVGLSFLSA